MFFHLTLQVCLLASCEKFILNLDFISVIMGLFKGVFTASICCSVVVFFIFIVLYNTLVLWLLKVI